MSTDERESRTNPRDKTIRAVLDHLREQGIYFYTAHPSGGCVDLTTESVILYLKDREAFEAHFSE